MEGEDEPIKVLGRVAVVCLAGAGKGEGAGEGVDSTLGFGASTGVWMGAGEGFCLVGRDDEEFCFTGAGVWAFTGVGEGLVSAALILSDEVDF